MMHTRRMGRVAAGLLAAALTLPALGLAVTETTPYTLEATERPRREDAGKIPVFCRERGTKDISASREWLWQARLNGVLVNLRLFAPDGEGTLFQEQLEVITPGYSDLRLYLRQRTRQGGLMLQLDGKAVRVLKNCGIREIILADQDYYLQNTFDVAELAAMRALLGLTEGEQLCVGGEDDPVTIVSETGVRRLAGQ